MGWNSFWKDVGNGFKKGVEAVGDGLKYVGGKVADFGEWAIDKYNNTQVGRFVGNMLTGNIPGLLGQTASVAIDAWAPDWVKESSWVKPLTMGLTGDIQGLAGHGIDSAIKYAQREDDPEEEEEAKEEEPKDQATENKATVDKISEEVTNKVQDSDNSANLNQGDTQAEAAFKADLNVADNQENVETGLRNSVGNIDAQSQADYLQKLGYSEQLDLMADNLKKGKTLQVTNAVINGAFSDIQVKENITPTPLREAVEAVKELSNEWSDEEVVMQLASIDTIDYTYKPEFSNDTEPHVGITAQSLYTVPIFKQTIVETPDNNGNVLLQVDIVKATNVLYNIAVPALERTCGFDQVSIIQDDEDTTNDEWRLLESNINLAANIAKQLMHVDRSKIVAYNVATPAQQQVQQQPVVDEDFAQSIQTPQVTDTATVGMEDIANTPTEYASQMQQEVQV